MNLCSQGRGYTFAHIERHDCFQLGLQGTQTSEDQQKRALNFHFLTTFAVSKDQARFLFWQNCSYKKSWNWPNAKY